MSRASELRDALVAELTERLPDETVEAFLVPNYEREDLEDSEGNPEPRIVVRVAGRDIRVMQGPDERYVVMDVGVVGIGPAKTETTPSGYRIEELARCDVYDGLMESVIALWTPNGPLVGLALANHRFASISQAIQFDADRLYNASIWLSMIQLTFFDCIDEYDEE